MKSCPPISRSTDANPMGAPEEVQPQVSGGVISAGTAFGCPRDFLDNRFVYTVISPRARGLSVGVNVNPDRRCNFDCAYCEVDRRVASSESRLDVRVMIAELERTLLLSQSGGLRSRAGYRHLPAELLQLRHVTLSGDGEPTLADNFTAVVEAVTHLRARGRLPFFKIVLLTNASGFQRTAVTEGLRLLTPRDEIWAKLDAGTQAYFERINLPDCRLEQILAEILRVARERPVIIQSLFPALAGQGPPASEIEAYAQNLKTLRDGGAQIPLVQIYSATRPMLNPDCGHLPLRTLSAIAQRVREIAQLPAEVF